MAKINENFEFDEATNKEVLEALEALRKRYGYNYREIGRRGQISQGGLEGLRKMTKLTPQMATKISLVFGYPNWHEMLQGEKTYNENGGVPADRKGSLEFRVQNLENKVFELEKLLNAFLEKGLLQSKV